MSFPLPGDLTVTFVVKAAVFSFLIWVIWTLLYRRYLHPLAKVPGPPLAAITSLWYYYHQVIRKGSVHLQFEPLTEKYGPLVRTGPNEVLVANPVHHNKIYSMTSRYAKDPQFFRPIGGGSRPLFWVCGIQEHSRRRAVLNPFFSRRQVLENESIVHDKVDKLVSKIHEQSARGEATDLIAGIRAVAFDSFTLYLFGEDGCFNMLEDEKVTEAVEARIRNRIKLFFMFKIVPWLERPFMAMPIWLAKLVNPVTAVHKEDTKQAESRVSRIIDKIKSDTKPRRPSIYHVLLGAEYAKAHKAPSLADLTLEGSDLMNASDNTGKALAVAARHVIADRAIYTRLYAELEAAFSGSADRMSLNDLESLPYLTAVVKECLRLNYGSVSSLLRIVPKGGATFEGVYLPAGTTVSMSNWLMHRQPEAFPDPDRFDPDRWLHPTLSQARERLLSPFGRGQYQCIGKALAMAQLYIILGRIFGEFDDLIPYIETPHDEMHVANDGLKVIRSRTTF